MRPVYMELLGPKPAEVRITVSQGNTDVMVRWCGLMLNPSAVKTLYFFQKNGRGVEV